MDNLTHSLFGLTLARTPLSRAGRGTTTALLLASNAPDIDVIVAAGGAARYLELHRGPTHGPVGVVGLAFIVAALVWLGRRRWDRNSTDLPAPFLMLWTISMFGILGHVLMDLPTSYGTRLLSPFTWTWFAVDWMPIVDIYLLAILGGSLWLSRGRTDGPSSAVRRQRNAAIALLLMGVNYGLRAVAHHTAVARAPIVLEGRLSEWCEESVRPNWAIDRWPRFPASSPRDRAAAHCLVEIAAMPNFISPFRWRIIAQLSNGYEMGELDLLRGAGVSTAEAFAPSTLPVRIPNQWTPAVITASAAPVASVFLGFSRFPAARSTVAEDGSATVRWSDVRFVTDALADPRQLRGGLFAATVVLAPDGQVRADRLGP